MRNSNRICERITESKTKTFAVTLYPTTKFINNIDIEMINSLQNQRIADIAENLVQH